MKNKKLLAISLSICIIASSFSGVYISYAMSSKESDDYNEFNLSKAPDQKITQIEPDLNSQEVEPASIISNDTRTDVNVIYTGTDYILGSENLYISDVFDIGEKEIEVLVNEGYSLKDIFEADEIANQIFIDPIQLLTIKKESNKSLKDIKEDVIKERKEESTLYLTDKYKEVYGKLKNESLTQDQIIVLLAYIDVNGIKLTGDLIKEYKSKGDNLFMKDEDKLSKETKNKYQLSDKDSEVLSEEAILALEVLSEKTRVPVDELINLYLKENKN